MFQRRPKNPDDENDRDLIDAFVDGPVTIAVRAYAFGQFRIQIWIDRGYTYPDIIGPEC